MFALREPSDNDLGLLLRRQRERPLSYAEAGATLAGAAPAGYSVEHGRARLGEGWECFRRAADALAGWRMFDTGWTRLFPEDAALSEGAVVCVVARHFGLYSVNPARVIRVLDEEDACYRRYGFVYGTLPAHSERGEERFSVEISADAAVYYNLYSFARGNSLPVRLGYPVRRLVQRRFSRDSRRAMIRAAGW